MTVLPSCSSVRTASPHQQVLDCPVQSWATALALSATPPQGDSSEGLPPTDQPSQKELESFQVRRLDSRPVRR